MIKFGSENYLSNREYDELDRDDLVQCRIIKWVVVDYDQKWLAVLFPWGNCCDMDGCIKRAKEHMPKVERISTINQNGIDTFYSKDTYGNRWSASRRGPRPPGFETAPYSDEPGR